jgi:hypothetical protein
MTARKDRPAKPSPYISAGAELSADGRYRYLLSREWRGTHDRANWRWFGGRDGAGAELGEPRACLFIMLNPSTADGSIDDPTIRRCVGFARLWKFERLEVVNLFAFRATKPRDLFAVPPDADPVGVDNSEYVTDAAVRAGRIVCAWGNHGGYLGQDETLRGWLPSDQPHWALGFTDAGFPRHPLYARADTQLVRMP